MGRTITDGSGHPVPGWDPDEAVAIVQRETHAYVEHKAWIEAQLLEFPKKRTPCRYCALAALKAIEKELAA